jgi:hypothetical protein
VQCSFADALVQYGFTNREGGAMDKSIRSNYAALLENEDEVRAWWDQVPVHKKRSVSHRPAGRRPPTTR